MATPQLLSFLMNIHHNLRELRMRERTAVQVMERGERETEEIMKGGPEDNGGEEEVQNLMEKEGGKGEVLSCQVFR